MIVVSQDGRAFVDLELTMCVKINVRHAGAYDILAMSGAVTQWLGTYNSEDDAAIMLGTLMGLKRFKQLCHKMFIMPHRTNAKAIEKYRVILESEGEKDD
jgi:hypothetical protein